MMTVVLVSVGIAAIAGMGYLLTPRSGAVDGYVDQVLRTSKPVMKGVKGLDRPLRSDEHYIQMPRETMEAMGINPGDQVRVQHGTKVDFPRASYSTEAPKPGHDHPHFQISYAVAERLGLSENTDALSTVPEERTKVRIEK